MGRYTKVASNGELGYAYKGEFNANKRSGLGQCDYSDGSTYNGLWCDDEFVEGSLTTKDGSTSFEGTFQAGKSHGLGTLTVKGTTYEGALELPAGIGVDHGVLHQRQRAI